MDMLYFFLPLIVLLGIITSYTDFKYKKIRNRHLAWFLSAGILLYIIFITIFFLQKQLNYFYILELCTNILIAFSIGYLFWKNNVWSGGDAKLFITYSLLVPFTVYQLGHIKYFPAFTLLVNIFVPLAIFYLGYALSKAKKEQIILTLKNTLDSKELAKGTLSLFTFFWILRLIGVQDIFLKYFMLFILANIIRKLFKNQFYLLLPLAALRFFLDSSIYSQAFLWRFISYFFIYLILRATISNLSDEIFQQKISVKKLKPGMIIGEPIKLYNKIILKPTPTGLTQKDINKLRKIKKHIKAKVNNTLDFAIFMFIGVIITILVKGNIIVFIAKFIN